MRDNIAVPLVIGAIGALMLLFPHAFITLQDVRAVWRGYTPIEGHFMRSPLLCRLAGAFFIFLAWIVWKSL